jgi:hypothetical protein
MKQGHGAFLYAIFILLHYCCIAGREDLVSETEDGAALPPFRLDGLAHGLVRDRFM